MQIIEAPSPPRGPLDISGMTDTSVTIKWHEPESNGGSTIIEYLVERKEVTKKAWQKVGSTTSEITHIEVTALKVNYFPALQKSFLILNLFSSIHHTTSALPPETRSAVVYHSHLMRPSPLARESVSSNIKNYYILN
jgi:Fibronectin type III domain